MTRILIADDDKDVRTALRVALEGEGYDVETVPNGERAMQVHEKRPADVLIADLFMPERDGFETVKYFRARKPGMRIVAISGWQRGRRPITSRWRSSRRRRHLAQAIQAG